MNITIENLTVIKEEYLKDFIFKKELSEVELYGLEWILSKLIIEHYEDLGKDYCLNLVDDYTVHKEDRLSILDGVTDIFIIGNHGVSEVFLTENNIVVFECAKLDDDLNPIEDTEYYVSVN